MKSWVERTWIGFDTETTGLDIHDDRIITASVIERPGGANQTGDLRDHSWLIDPKVPIAPAASAIHGITNEMVREHGQDEAEALAEISQLLVDHLRSGSVLVVFNASFDVPLLKNCLQRVGLPTLEDQLGSEVAPIADPLVLDRLSFPRRRRSRKLTDLVGVYGLPQIENAHQSSDDAVATLAVLEALVRQFPQVGAWNDLELMEAQRNGHWDWATDFEVYLRSKGQNRRIRKEWP